MSLARTHATESHTARLASFGTVALFAFTLFVSSSLMFVVEPMIARLVTPILGGAPMVWNTCVMFFQIVLLAGYGYALVLSRRLNLQSQMLIHVAVLTTSAALLPFAIGRNVAPPSGNPIAWLVARLAVSVGLPFFAVSTSASVLQHWFSRTAHRRAHDPYFLYTASNLGSFLGLIAYPGVVEPTLRLRTQNRAWAIGYLIFVGLVIVCASVIWRSGTRVDQGIQRDAAREIVSAQMDRPSWRRRARWVALSFLPSSLMLAVTSYLSTDIAAVPLLWVIPLGVYLLTFVLAFGGGASRYAVAANRAMPLLLLPIVLFVMTQVTAPLVFVVPLHVFGFAAAALVCHTQLAADRPRPSGLTEFYFWIALGGMFGGAFNTLIAPAVFTNVIEYPLALVGACLLRTGVDEHAGTAKGFMSELAVPGAIAALTLAIGLALTRSGAPPGLVMFAFGVPAVACFSQSRRPLRFAFSIVAMLLVGSYFGRAAYGRVLYAQRTFFGVYRVATDSRHHLLFHGTTLHGMQAIDESRRAEPLTYYHRTGPIGQAFALVPQLSRTPAVGIVGLGVGSLASYAAADQHWTFYEIDPAVERIARNETFFTYLRDCGGRCSVIIGDARLSLARAQPGTYGLIVLDAFSSDAIPVHLMTSEAMDLYLSRLAPGGALAFHVSNRYLLLGPVLARIAATHHLVALEQAQRVTEAESLSGKRESDWIVMARTPDDLRPLTTLPEWKPPRSGPSTPLWTDDFSNLLSVLRLR